ncbi:MAG: glycosyltransferase, partial [Clostridia bacterium]|nr:glycosyltransferase [Clostridia bacterium]
MVQKMLVGFLLDGKHSGIDKYLLGFCDAAREAGAKLDFLTQEIDPELKEHLTSYGFGLLAVPSLKRPFSQRRAIKCILRNGSYDAIYLNLSEAFNCTLLSAAKACGVPVRIAHSHSSGVDRMSGLSRTLRGALHKLFRPYLSRNATRRLACSSAAGEWMFDRPFETIRNAVSSQRF